VAVEAFVNAGAKAIIISALAPGLPASLQTESIEQALKKGVIIVYSTRAGSGRVLRRQSMIDSGIVAADNLNPQKARVLTMLALTISNDPEVIQKFFDRY
jgi:L-asparaginase